ncbi:unnamed protein product, partial [Chrysoparadoxa australica]
FWGPQPLFENLTGVLATEVGYTGGRFPFPTYESVCSGITGHTEALWMRFDPNVITYDELLKVFLKNHSSYNTAPKQYMSAVFYKSEAQRQAALKQLEAFEVEMNRKPYTKVVKASKWWKAEEYHQDYLWKKKQRGGR